MPKGRKINVSISEGLPGQRRIAGMVVHMTVKSHDREHKFYPGRVCESVDGKRGNSYGEILEKMQQLNQTKKCNNIK